MTIGPYIIDGGTLAPYEQADQTNQRFDIDGDGGVITHSVPWDVEYFRAKFRCSKDIADGIRNFIKYGMNYRANTFTFVDPFGASHTVRYWDNKIKRTFIAPDLYEMDIPMRRDV